MRSDDALSPREKKEQQRVYLEGLKQYRDKGIPIIIDGEELEEKDWGKIFEVCEDKYYYMSDFVGLEDGKLTEIHFDKVYYE
ncbi:MAG: hypothetical protein KH366_07700 [Clostridiaceae bacterium]|nr:hypothetical protein [Clostridiaceae bacterium]